MRYTVKTEPARPVNTLYSASAALRSAFAVLIVLSSAVSVFPQTRPFVDGEVITYPLAPLFSSSVSVSDTSDSRQQLICSFTLTNPDTVPFYLWVTFDGGGRMRYSTPDGGGAANPPLRLVGLELRYKDNQHVPIVKEFPNNGYGPRPKKRVGGAWAGGGWVRKKRGARAPEERVSHRAPRDRGAYEIPFWPEDVQGRYEMEVWGAIYSPDLKRAFAGRYSETVKFDIEVMP